MRRSIDNFYGVLFFVSSWALFGICISSAICSEPARGDTFLTTRELSFFAGGYVGANYDPYLMRRLDDNSPYRYSSTGLYDDEKLSMSPRVRFDFDLYCSSFDEICFYWNNEVIGKSTNQQYRFTQWSFENGIAFKKVDLFFNHLSAHCLECIPEYHDRYPNENIVGIRFNLIKNPRQTERGGR